MVAKNAPSSSRPLGRKELFRRSDRGDVYLRPFKVTGILRAEAERLFKALFVKE